MRHLASAIVLASVALAPNTGCQDNAPRVPRVPPPAPGYETVRREYEHDKPMPPRGGDPTMSPQPFDDPPLLIDNPPEVKRFVDVYRQVGRPKIVVFVNRTLDGQLLTATAAERGARSRGDELNANPIDYAMMETLLADWMSADSQVTIMSPATVRRQLTDEQVKGLQAGDAPLSDIARQLDADILVQVQARPTRQTPAGLELRILADAVNLSGGESLARATVDLIPPLDKPQLNKYTRFISRKLMDGMATAWSVPAPAKAPPPQQ